MKIMSDITIRASSLGGFFDCPARFKATHIENRRIPSTGKAILGRAIHASTAVYDQSRIDGTGITIDESVGAAVDLIHKPDEEVSWEDDNPKDAERIAISLHVKYCNEVAPTQTYQAVEIACDALEISDLGITLTGTTDRIRVTPDGYGIVDIKTGKAAVSADGTVKTSSHAMQQAVYELLASHAIGERITAPALIVGMNTAKTSASQRVGIGEIHYAMDVLLGDEDSPGALEIVSRMIHADLMPGNPRSMMCHKRFCPVYDSCRWRR